MGGWKRIGTFPPTFNFAASARNIWEASIGFYGNGLIDVEEISKILKRFWQRKSREIRNSCNTILLSLISLTSLRRIRRFLGVVFPPSPKDGCYFSGKQMKGIVPAEFIEVAWFENISLCAPKINKMYDYLALFTWRALTTPPKQLSGTRKAEWVKMLSVESCQLWKKTHPYRVRGEGAG